MRVKRRGDITLLSKETLTPTTGRASSTENGPDPEMLDGLGNAVAIGIIAVAVTLALIASVYVGCLRWP